MTDILINFVGSLLSNSNISLTDVIDIKITITLLAIGYGIKHLKCLNKISNQIIPFILIIFSFLLNFLNIDSMTPSSISSSFVNSIVTASVSIGLHQQGKIIIKYTKKITKSAAKTFEIELKKNINDKK
jgi:hypothetical protein